MSQPDCQPGGWLAGTLAFLSSAADGRAMSCPAVLPQRPDYRTYLSFYHLFFPAFGVAFWTHSPTRVSEQRGVWVGAHDDWVAEKRGQI